MATLVLGSYSTVLNFSLVISSRKQEEEEEGKKRTQKNKINKNWMQDRTLESSFRPTMQCIYEIVGL